MTVVENAKPELFLYVTRAFELEPAVAFFLGNSYVDIGGGIWLRAVTPKQLATKTIRTATGSCSVRSSDLRSLIDDAFGAGVTRVHVLELRDLMSMETKSVELPAVASDSTLEWSCSDGDRAILRTRPRRIARQLDLRFLFGFETNY